MANVFLQRVNGMCLISTCMPHKRTPNDADVLAAHLAICLLRFSADASSPCCLVPIFKSSMHGFLYWNVMFSSSKKSVDKRILNH